MRKNIAIAIFVFIAILLPLVGLVLAFLYFPDLAPDICAFVVVILLVILLIALFAGSERIDWLE